MVFVVAASLRFRDDKMQTSSMRFYLDAESAAGGGGVVLQDQTAALRVAAQLVCDAHITDSFEQITEPVAGAHGVYATVEDKAVICLQSAKGILHRYQLAGPRQDSFLDDHETVSFANENMAALVAVMKTWIVDSDGNRMTNYVGGYRRRSKAQRRFNVRTRNTLLTGQGL